jgi:hypothetical protein
VYRFLTKPFNTEPFDLTMRDLAERVDDLGCDGEIEARQARRDELVRRVERVLPVRSPWFATTESSSSVDEFPHDPVPSKEFPHDPPFHVRMILS